MAHQRGTGLAVAGDDVDDAIRKNSLAQFAKPQARQWCLLGALDHHSIADRERRRCLLGAEAEWMIERTDLGNNTERLAACQIKMAAALRERLALDLGDEASAITQPARRPDHVAMHADNGVAGIDRVKQCELIGVVFDAVGKELEAPCAFLYRHARPFAKGSLGRRDCGIDISRASFGNSGELLHVRWVD